MILTHSTDLAICIFHISGGHEYLVQVKSRSLASHYLGEDSEAKNVELFAEYDVNGIPGYGIVEWNYRNTNKNQLL
jgi:hypothetical protein